ncbi:Xaa-Pro aminopeptidase [Methylogaea oryzae]|uniref:Xaa-Pro aminopeptidase n=2 Tax=Methylogaea oryzae TaxID=1295382 RepID=A0A8D4VUR6_9GAMM|nr:Xaa-Pro aminopeptidase [Methylogaea oryzae]
MRMVGKGGIALIPSAPELKRNRDVDYPFRQDSDFYYLTGFNEPEALAVLIPGREQGEYLLFCREFDPQKALWTGRHAGLDGARDDFGADDAFPMEDLDEILPGLLENRERVYYPMDRGGDLHGRLLDWVHQLRDKARSGVTAPSEFVSVEHLLHDMRLFKSPAELAVMRKAAQVSAAAHVRAMKACRPGLFEYQIEAELLHEFTLNGMRSPAYPSIVAGGVNACVLHYTDNDAKLQDGDLLLIDAGAEHANYAADITRTFPVNGRFSEPQRALYELVLEAQEAAIAQIKPGAHWNEPHDAAVRTLTRGLVKLGLLKGKVDKLIKDETYKQFYMHRTGHWLGMDVHDVGDYKVGGEWRMLEPGMVLTVEPGLYVAPDCKKVDKCWRGIGIRIEDDVLVTKAGCEILTGGAPKTVAEIERVMQA